MHTFGRTQGAISLGQQLNYFKEYQSKVAAVAGSSHAAALTSGSIYVVSAGTSDYVQNYYVNAMLAAAYTPDQFADALMTPFTAFIEVTNQTDHSHLNCCRKSKFHSQ
jgi:hypothetical protein